MLNAQATMELRLSQQHDWSVSVEVLTYDVLSILLLSYPPPQKAVLLEQ